MHRTAPKCEHCRKAYAQVKVSQKYCSHRCRQAAYRRRKVSDMSDTRKPKVDMSTLTPATCHHCNGSFWAKSARATFCSTSCRVMAHRAMRAAIPDALALIYAVPSGTASDILETMPIARVKALLSRNGWTWNGQRRAWVQAIEFQGMQA